MFPYSLEKVKNSPFPQKICIPEIHKDIPEIHFYQVPLFPEILFHIPLIPQNILKCFPQFLSYKISVFHDQLFSWIYLTSHSRGSP